MKKFIVLALFLTMPRLLLAQSAAQGVSPNVNTNAANREYTVVGRVANSRVWATIISRTNAAGRVIARTNASYSELGANLCVRDASGKWSDSEGGLSPVADGASSGNSPLAVHFSGDAKTDVGTVRLTSPDGKVFVSKVYGISYYDPTVPTNILIASLQSSQGQLVGAANDHVYYPNAFTGLNADLWYSYTPSGISQDIVLHDCPPLPAAYGLNPQTTRIQVLTEWFNPPEPRHVTAEDDGIAHDAYLDFGNMIMGPGAALFTQGQADPVPVESGTVYKHWGPIKGSASTWLVEEIRYPVVANLLQTLPLHASAEKPGRDSLYERIAASPPLRPKSESAGAGKPILIAKSFPRQPGLVLDYNMVSSVANFTFQSDTTYYVSANATMSGTNTTFEQGTVLKYASGAGLTVTSPVTWLGSPYMPVYLCSKDDNGPGAPISGSSGNPGTAYYANPAIYFNGASAGTNLILHDARILNAKTAVAINGNSNHVVSSVQMVNCGNGVAATNTSYSLWNGLLWNVMTNFTGSSSTVDVEQVTVDTANWLNHSQIVNLTNCLLVAVTSTGSFTSNAVYTASSGGSVFQSVGGGSHYLPAGSPYLGAGTTGIAPALAATLPQLTTYAPVLLSSGFSSNTTLSPEVARGTGIPAAGYYYYPLDFVCHDLTVNSGVTLTLTNGVALGFMDVTGITVNGSLVSQGTPVNLNHVMSTLSAQETSLGEELYFLLIGWNGGWQNLYFRFTDLPNPGGAAPIFWMDDSWGGENVAGPITIRDSQLRAPVVWMNVGDNGGVATTSVETLNWTNNLIERGGVYFLRSQAYVPANLVVNSYNNLYHYGILDLEFIMASSENAPPTSPCPLPWAMYDNLFESANFTETGTDSLGGSVWPTLIANGYNGYLNQSSLLSSSGGDKTPSAGDYQTGALGTYYYPTSGGNLSSLIHAGSTLAANLELYHYTVTTNNAVEGTSTVSIGYHYVAVGANGLPLDYSGGGIPNYLKDANGNGVYDAGDLGDWLDGTTCSGGLSDYFMVMQGRSFSVCSSVVDTNGARIGLTTYTPLQ